MSLRHKGLSNGDSRYVSANEDFMRGNPMPSDRTAAMPGVCLLLSWLWNQAYEGLE